MFNIPNCLTLSRFLLAAILTWALVIDPMPVSEPSMYKIIAFWAFVVGGITDFLDGYIARKYQLITNFGKLIDPLADKILVSAAFIYLSAVSICPFWITIVIISREFLITGLRQLAVEQGQVIAADRFGKWKTICQLIYCGLCLFALTHGTALPAFLSILAIGEIAQTLCAIFLWASLTLTLISAVNYCWKARHLFH